MISQEVCWAAVIRAKTVQVGEAELGSAVATQNSTRARDHQKRE
jgi:hypothetical protein